MHESSAPALDSKLLEHVGDLNRRLLELLVATAAGQATGLDSPVVNALRPHWQRLSAAALQRLADCPYLLMDLAIAADAFEFGTAGRIREPALAAMRPAVADGSEPMRELRWRALLTAWHFSHINPLAARIGLGLGAGDCAALAAAPLAALEAVSARRGWRLCIRWEDRPEVWRQLLQAADADEARPQLRQLQLRGLQLLAGRLLPGSAGQHPEGGGRGGSLC